MASLRILLTDASPEYCEAAARMLVADSEVTVVGYA